MAERFGWRATFALLGFTGMAVSLPLVAKFVSDTPRAHSIPRPPHAHRQDAPAPNRPNPTAPAKRGQNTRFALWLYIGAGTCNAFCVFGILNWLPSYLNRTRGIEFDELSLPLFSVFVSGILGILFWAYLGDKTGMRVPFASTGLLLAGVCVLLTAFAPTNALVMTLLMLGVFLQSSYNAQEFATLQAMAHPARVGATTGLYNGTTVLLGGVGGSLIPGTIVALTGDFQAGLLSVALGAWLVSLLMAILSVRSLKQQTNSRFQ
ncbi:MAG: MFS transporter [Fimbriimonadales bacterium]|nr:MFS transporter [Fimbriimonadales bacterium]